MRDSSDKPKPLSSASNDVMVAAAKTLARVPTASSALSISEHGTAETRAPAKDHDDIALIHGRTDDGKGLKIVRRRQDRIEVGAVVPLTPGKPITGEVVRLEPREESPLLCNVHVEYTPPAAARSTSAGPAQVATESYRENWELVFGKRDGSKPVLS